MLRTNVLPLKLPRYPGWGWESVAKMDNLAQSKVCEDRNVTRVGISFTLQPILVPIPVPGIPFHYPRLPFNSSNFCFNNLSWLIFQVTMHIKFQLVFLRFPSVASCYSAYKSVTHCVWSIFPAILHSSVPSTILGMEMAAASDWMKLTMTHGAAKLSILESYRNC